MIGIKDADLKVMACMGFQQRQGAKHDLKSWISEIRVPVDNDVGLGPCQVRIPRSLAAWWCLRSYRTYNADAHAPQVAVARARYSTKHLFYFFLSYLSTKHLFSLQEQFIFLYASRTLFMLHPLMYHRFFFPSMCCRRTVRARSNKQQLYRTSLSSFFLGPAAYCPSIRYCSTFVAFFFLSKSDAPTFLTIKKVDAAPFSFRVE